jgi:hypothetical protein
LAQEGNVIARYHGKSGRLYASTTGTGTAVPVASLSHWSVDMATDTAETTSFGDTNKTYVQGLPDISVSFEGFYDDAESTIYTASTSADGTKLYLYISTNAASKYLYGPAWLNFSLDTSVSDAVKVSGAASANGAWGIRL